VALIALVATASQREVIVDKLNVPAPLMDTNVRRDAMLDALNGLALDDLTGHLLAPVVQRASSAKTSLSTASMPRVLFLTNAGDGVNGEAAIWLICKQLSVGHQMAHCDVVFLTGNPVQRAMRWASVLVSLGKGPKPGEGSVRYHVGPATSHAQRYHEEADQDTLMEAGMGELGDSPYMGGTYDVVVQASPLHGFDKNLVGSGLEGSLSRVKVNKDGKCKKLYIVIGTEGSTNCPKDQLHQGFGKHLRDQGFIQVHMDGRHLVRWNPEILEVMPPKLAAMVTDDEWNKVVGRISPSGGTLLTRFRVNTSDNFTAVGNAWQAFSVANRNNPAFEKVDEWWTEFASKAEDAIKKNYIKMSRSADKTAGSAAFGNPKVGDMVKGMTYTWEAVMHEDCVEELTEILSAKTGKSTVDLRKTTVDDAMCLAVLVMSGKLLRIYAFDNFSGDRTPDPALILMYLSGTSFVRPMDFYLFPRLFRDISVFKRMVLGSPMYGPSGILLAMLTLVAGSLLQSSKGRSKRPSIQSEISADGETQRMMALLAAYEGESKESLSAHLMAFHSLVDVLPSW